MSLFSFFKKKSPSTKIIDNVYISDAVKYKALANVAEKAPTVFVAWFEDSMKKLQDYFQQRNTTATVIMYNKLHGGVIGSRNVVFIEHYPLKEKEENVFTTLNQQEIIVYSSLDEILFKMFGGDRIRDLFIKMGINDDEAISHSMITKSLQQAQEKLAKQITLEQTAHSQQEWMRKNIG